MNDEIVFLLRVIVERLARIEELLTPPRKESLTDFQKRYKKDASED